MSSKPAFVSRSRQDPPIVLGILDHQDGVCSRQLSLLVDTDRMTTLKSSLHRAAKPVDTTACMPTKRREMTSQSVPPFARVLLLSTCWNSRRSSADRSLQCLGPYPDRDIELAVDGLGVDLDLACFCKLDGIAHEVEQHLRETSLIAAPIGRSGA